jgi:hypothetical protein
VGWVIDELVVVDKVRGGLQALLAQVSTSFPNDANFLASVSVRSSAWRGVHQSRLTTGLQGERRFANGTVQARDDGGTSRIKCLRKRGDMRTDQGFSRWSAQLTGGRIFRLGRDHDRVP